MFNFLFIIILFFEISADCFSTQYFTEVKGEKGTEPGNGLHNVIAANTVPEKILKLGIDANYSLDMIDKKFKWEINKQ